jgi:hypothetical protein
VWASHPDVDAQINAVRWSKPKSIELPFSTVCLRALSRRLQRLRLSRAGCHQAVVAIAAVTVVGNLTRFSRRPQESPGNHGTAAPTAGRSRAPRGSCSPHVFRTLLNRSGADSTATSIRRLRWDGSHLPFVVRHNGNLLGSLTASRAVLRRDGSRTSPARPHGCGDGLWRFGLRVVAHTCKLSHRGMRQDLGGPFKDVAARYGVVRAPHEM